MKCILLVLILAIALGSTIRLELVPRSLSVEDETELALFEQEPTLSNLEIFRQRLLQEDDEGNDEDENPEYSGDEGDDYDEDNGADG